VVQCSYIQSFINNLPLLNPMNPANPALKRIIVVGSRTGIPVRKYLQSVDPVYCLYPHTHGTNSQLFVQSLDAEYAACSKEMMSVQSLSRRVRPTSPREFQSGK